MPKNRSFTSGVQAEQLAAGFLHKKGYTIIQQNWRTPGGEIDIIAKKDGILVFVEVKMRRMQTFGTPEDAFTPLKLRRTMRAMYRYLEKYKPHRCKPRHGGGQNIRLDLITLDWYTPQNIKLRHYRNILEFMD